MVTSYAIKVPKLLLFLLVALHMGCDPAHDDWVPEGVLTSKPDSGLTTQTFDLMIDIPNLPTTQNEFYMRWDLNGDSLWDDSFTAYKTTAWRFYKPGIHRVKAEILTKDGQRLTLSRDITINQGYSPPHVSFTIDPPIGNYLTEFTFDGSATFDDEDSLETLRYRWDLNGDGVWDTDYSSNPIVKYVFKRSDLYSVQFSAVDPTGRTSNAIKSLEVNMIDERIHPDFTWSSLNGTVKDTFLLDASGTYYESDPSKVFTYTWYIFGEEKFGPFTDPVFPHVFKEYGQHKLILTVTDELDLSNSCTKELYVIRENKPPSPGIVLSTPYGNINTNFYFSAWPSSDDVTIPSEMLIRWDFEGDGIWDTGWTYEKTVFHQYLLPGTYWVTLEAEDEGGEKAMTKSRIMVSSSTAQTGYIRDMRDYKYYGTVRIGDQWWMSDNLDYRVDSKTYKEYRHIQECYDCDLYGAIYRVDVAIEYIQDGNNLCPHGWHFPTKEDWLELQKHIPVTGGRDAMMVGGMLGFNARYAGFAEVSFISTTVRNHFDNFQRQFYMGLQNDYDGVDFLWGDMRGFYYARCIKDEL